MSQFYRVFKYKNDTIYKNVCHSFIGFLSIKMTQFIKMYVTILLNEFHKKYIIIIYDYF